MKNLRQHRRFFVLSDTSEQTAQRGRFAPTRQSEPVNCGKGNAAGVDSVK